MEKEIVSILRVSPIGFDGTELPGNSYKIKFRPGLDMLVVIDKEEYKKVESNLQVSLPFVFDTEAERTAATVSALGHGAIYPDVFITQDEEIDGYGPKKLFEMHRGGI